MEFSNNASWFSRAEITLDEVACLFDILRRTKRQLISTPHKDQVNQYNNFGGFKTLSSFLWLFHQGILMDD